MNQILSDILLNPKRNCKNIRNYVAKHQKCPKIDNNQKNHYVDTSTLVFGFTIMDFSIKKTHKKNWEQAVLKMWFQNFEKRPNFAFNILCKKKLKAKFTQISK